MATNPPSPSDIDTWLAESGLVRQIISSSYIPNKGFHVSAVVAGFTTDNGNPQFMLLPGDPTSDLITARQLHGLVSQFGGVTVRKYAYQESMPNLTPQGLAAGIDVQTRISNMDNWVQIRS